MVAFLVFRQWRGLGRDHGMDGARQPCTRACLRRVTVCCLRRVRRDRTRIVSDDVRDRRAENEMDHQVLEDVPVRTREESKVETEMIQHTVRNGRYLVEDGPRNEA